MNRVLGAPFYSAQVTNKVCVAAAENCDTTLKQSQYLSTLHGKKKLCVAPNV